MTPGHSDGHDGHGEGGHGDHGDHMGDGHGDHGDHMGGPTPPGVGASAAEIATYLDHLFSLGETHTHDMSSELHGEHMAAMNLAPRDASTHVAIADGDWFDPSIWHTGEVPGENAKVLIPEGVAVTYGGLGEPSLFTVRVDGALDFATDVSSSITFDTMIVSPTGRLVIGDEQDNVDANVTVDLIVADNGPIDTDWDPLLLSRGLISHGETTIHGAVKDSHEKVVAAPMAGDTSIQFAEVPVGWQVGDTIVVAGTRYDGYKWSQDGIVLHENEDEVRVITQIDDDGVVHFDEPLRFDHDAPRDDLNTSVANYTRNVSIETENAASVETHERGHIMFMHSDAVDVRYLEVHELGRTDKSETSVSAGDQVNDYDTNVQGRYAIHLHRTGTSDQDNPAVISGSSVWGSPGWGFVHHDSHAILENNASFNTFGAGFVAETGNETGAWVENIAIYAEGVSWAAPKFQTKLGPDTFDTANGGDGFWFQGRMVASVDNVAASVNTGFVYFHRDGDNRMIDVDAAQFDYPDALFGNRNVDPADVPILMFQDNEAFAAKEGLHVVKANPKQGHDVWSHIEDFTAWSVKSGVYLEYTAHYILSGIDVIGKDATSFSSPDAGISFGPQVSEIVIVDSKIDGFGTGIDLKKTIEDHETSADPDGYVIIDPIIVNTERQLDNFQPDIDRLIKSDDLSSDRPHLDLNPIVYGSGGGRLTLVTGTKTDSLGVADFPGGPDQVSIAYGDALRLLETDGYWTTSDGEYYFLADIHFTDRVTGDVYFETHPVFIPEGVGRQLGEPWWEYKNAIDNGTVDFVSIDGVLHHLDAPIGEPQSVSPPEPPAPVEILDVEMDPADDVPPSEDHSGDYDHSGGHDDGAAPHLDLDPIEYGSGAGRQTLITGTKTDSLGVADFPGGPDQVSIEYPDALRLLETDGYWTTSDGEYYFLADIYFTDRVTGDVYFETHPVFIPEGVGRQLGEPWWEYKNAIDNGTVDFVSIDGVLHHLDAPIGEPQSVAPPEDHSGDDDGAVTDPQGADSSNRAYFAEAGDQIGVSVSAINEWSALGWELDLPSGTDPAYFVHEFGKTAHFDGHGEVGANYWSIYTNSVDGGGEALSGSALETAEMFGTIVQHVETIIGTDYGDRMSGRNHDDVFNGGAGSDYLSMEGGDDVAIGGRGDDTIKLGDGEDLFVFAAGHGDDVIVDFAAEDMLQLMDLDVTDLHSIASTDDRTGDLVLNFSEADSIRFQGLTEADIASISLLT